MYMLLYDITSETLGVQGSVNPGAYLQTSFDRPVLFQWLL